MHPKLWFPSLKIPVDLIGQTLALAALPVCPWLVDEHPGAPGEVASTARTAGQGEGEQEPYRHAHL